MFKKFKGAIRETNSWRILTRAKIGFAYFKTPLRNLIHWIPRRTEQDNFYYTLTEQNLRTLSATISVVTKVPQNKIMEYIFEITNNELFLSKIRDYFSADKTMSDSTFGFGRRVGWYAVVRAIKPQLVVETGVHHGVGASIICEALIANKAEGFEGKYLGTDYDLNAGGLFKMHYSTSGEILYGDSVQSLQKITSSIDVFINDSDHSAEYELREYETVTYKLSSNSLILGDNAHVTTQLMDYSMRNRRSYLFFSEVPEDHWYPGGGIGFSFK